MHADTLWWKEAIRVSIAVGPCPSFAMTNATADENRSIPTRVPVQRPERAQGDPPIWRADGACQFR